MFDYAKLLAELPANISIGYSSISLRRPSELAKQQVGYSVRANGTSLSGNGDGDWHSNWLVIGNEDLCGDLIFIDTAAPGYPVFTAPNGEGRWDPEPVAVSLVGLREALAVVGRAAKGRENPVALEENPFSGTDREIILKEIQEHNPDIDLSFWSVVIGNEPGDD